MFGDRPLNAAADEAVTNAMYRCTFGIVGNGRDGREGRGIGTGIGINWNGTYVILTAAHTMQTTTDERQYFLLPGDSLAFQQSTITAHSQAALINRRVQLVSQHAVLDDERDLAAFILPTQPEEIAKRFYVLDRAHTTPPAADQVGFLGYPEATRLPAGEGFMATPYASFGAIMPVPADADPAAQLAVTYPTSGSVDAHGLSGAGLWLPESDAGPLWTPRLRLVGLVTHVDFNLQLLLGLKVEELVRFLATNIP
jgi:hypothetical protein